MKDITQKISTEFDTFNTTLLFVILENFFDDAFQYQREHIRINNNKYSICFSDCSFWKFY